MQFTSFEFILFFVIVYALYRLLNHHRQNRLLLLASYIFYGCWDWRFLSLIFLSTVVDFYCGNKIYNCSQIKGKRRYLYFSLIVNLGALGFFKYFNFFSENLQILTSSLGFTLSNFTLNIILPVGISFYTFQTLSYTIDIYNNKLKPEKHFLDYALFVAFFPQLVAGPIERAAHLLPQIKTHRTITPKIIKEGLWFIYWGCFLKIFVADNMAKIADLVFNSSGKVVGVEVLMGVYAFAFQIFGDFAGYSFIAIGVAKLLGFNLMINFLHPYFVTNPSDFWKHWHISLSSWLRDYVYIPFGGNRRGDLLTFRNLFLTMLLGGLWHGAAWTFILWGFYHWIILIIFRILKNVFPSSYAAPSIKQTIIYVSKIIIMFHITCIGWLIFRANSISQLYDSLHSIMFNFSPASNRLFYLFASIVFYSSFLVVVQIVQYKRKSLVAIPNLQGLFPWVFYLIMFYLLAIFGEYGGKQFIYFQF